MSTQAIARLAPRHLPPIGRRRSLLHPTLAVRVAVMVAIGAGVAASLRVDPRPSTAQPLASLVNAG